LAVDHFHLLPRELAARMTASDFAELQAEFQLRAEDDRRRRIRNAVEQSHAQALGEGNGSRARFGRQR